MNQPSKQPGVKDLGCSCSCKPDNLYLVWWQHVYPKKLISVAEATDVVEKTVCYLTTSLAHLVREVDV
jgi:hypothetical protein